MLRYALAIFLSAFLLFQVQPLISKFILPWFGGTPGVWTTAMLFFQVVLLAGYAYAHVVATRLGQRRQVIVHVVLLALAVATLPIIPSDRWKPSSGGNPAWQILALLGVCVGLPYFALATTSPLMQAWFSRTHPGRSPYRLYALSNVGSLLALLTYPFLFEPDFTLRTNAWLWSWAFVVAAGLAVWCALRAWGLGATDVAPAEVGNRQSAIGNPDPAPGLARRLMWLLLPACGSVMLLAVTNQMCLDVAVIPFLWIVPLGLYLLTFIIWFDEGRWFTRLTFWLWVLVALGVIGWAGYKGWGVLGDPKVAWEVALVRLAPLVGAVLYALSFFVCFVPPRWYTQVVFWLWLLTSALGITWLLHQGAEATIEDQIIYYSLGLLGCCMVCHGELVRLKPAPRYLTSFYLSVSAGGALGGLFVSLIAPVVFNAYLELNYGLWATCLLALVAFWLDARPHQRWPAPWYAALGVTLYFLVAVGVLVFGPFDWLRAQGKPVPKDILLSVWAAVGVLVAGAWTFIERPTRRRLWWVGAAAYFVLLAAIFYFKPFEVLASTQADGATANDELGLPWTAQVAQWLAGVAAQVRLEHIVGAWALLGVIVLGIWQRAWLWVLCLPAFLAFLVVLGNDLRALGSEAVSREGRGFISRSFYGVLKVGEYYTDDPERHQLILSHGRINHGVQLLSDDGRRRPITYFTESSGIGMAITHHPRKANGLRVGVLGLGTGTIAAYGKKGDVYRFYEIDPRVQQFSGRKGTDAANPVFTYLTDSEADCAVVLGDGRLSLEREPRSMEFDILAMDAFSSDAVPVHLLTREAFEVYLRHIKPDGIIAVNITNRHLDLRPVVWAQADLFGLQAIAIEAHRDYGHEGYYSHWMLVTRNEAFLQDPAIVAARVEKEDDGSEIARRTILWTDDYSNLFRILR